MDHAARSSLHALRNRMGSEALDRRHTLEERESVRTHALERHLRHTGQRFRDSLLEVTFRLFGLYGRGRRNFSRVQLRTLHWDIPGVPESLRGLRILHLSDLHLGIDSAIGESVGNVLEGLSYDLCIMTGDFFHRPALPSGLPQRDWITLAERIQAPYFGVLGNHDRLADLPLLESTGMRILLNEACSLTIAGESLWIGGVDDPRYFRTHDLARVRRAIPTAAFSILLAHDPVMGLEAATHGFPMIFCGHTHGGQICLPGGIPLVTHTRAPRRLSHGAWRHGDLRGYTSRGTGGGVIPLRFHCPPEVILHVM